MKEYPSALYSHCLCHSLNLSVEPVNNVSRSMKDVMVVCAEITLLIKCCLKIKRFLGKVIILHCVRCLNFICDTCIEKLKEESVAETRSHEKDIHE